MEQLAAEYRETRAAIEALGVQRQLVDGAHEEWQRSHADLRGAIDQAGAIARELDQLRSQASALAEDQAVISKTAEQVLDNTAVVTRTVKDIESKIDSLGMLHQLATTTEERLRSLNALAEHVSVKTKALDTQRETIDHAAAEASRLNEMVWAMEAQIGRLEDGNRQVAQSRDCAAAVPRSWPKRSRRTRCRDGETRTLHARDRESREGRHADDSSRCRATRAVRD